MRRVLTLPLRWPGPAAWRAAPVRRVLRSLASQASCWVRAVTGARPTIVDWPPDAVPQATLARCLVLAALLHVLLIAMFGTVPGGTARPGEGVSGTINVTLRGGYERGSSRDVREPVREAGPLGQAAEPRFGGAVRSEADAPRHNDGPGAARLGQWSSVRNEQASEVVASGELRPPDAPPAATAAAPEAAAPLLLPPTPQALPLPAAAPLEALPSVTPRAPAPEPSAAPGAQAPAQSLAERVAPRAAESRPTEFPRATPAPSSDSARLPQTPAVAAAVAEPAAAPAPAPALRSLSLPTPARPPTPALERLAPARIDSPPLPTLAETPQLPPARAADPVAERSLQALPAPAAPAPAAMPRVERLEPVPRSASLPALPDVPALPAISAAAPAPAAPASAATATAVAPAGAAAPVPATALPAGSTNTPGATAAAPARPAVVPGASLGSRIGPDAGPRVGQDIATPPSAAASAPRLNLELPRRAAGELSSQGSRGVLNLVPPPPERKSKLAEDIAKTARPDCKEAYAGLGILAPLPLAADALRGKGCKW